MEDHWMWYLTGCVDTTTNISVTISKKSDLNIGYSIEPRIHISRPKNVETIMGMFDEYLEEQNIQYNISELKKSNRITISNSRSVQNFLEPLVDGMIQQRERAVIMLDDLLPYFEDGRPTEKEEFIEVMGIVDEMKSHPISGRTSKYDQDYFLKEWSDEISQ